MEEINGIARETVELKLIALKEQRKTLHATLQAVHGAIQVCEQFLTELSVSARAEISKE